jgi:hypothetical protein
MEKNYRDLMNEKELEPITSNWDKPITKGTLIGFKGLGDEKGITAAYPVWRVIGNEIQFVLFWSKGSGKPCIDNTWFTSPHLYINKEPIILDIEIKNPETFSQLIVNIFNG